MGVSRKVFLVYGVEVPAGTLEKVADPDENEALYEQLEMTWRREGVGFITDGMSGEYEVVGKVIKVWGDDEDFLPSGIIDPETIAKASINENDLYEFEEFYRKWVGLETPDPKLLLLNHYY